jgi:AcrR family transcriptional regulator
MESTEDRPNRRERRTQQTRRAIVGAARELFESDGYAQTTVEQIAARADVAPRTFFRYFPTKETLLFAEFDEVRRDMLDELEQRPADEAPLQSLSIALAEYAEVVDRRWDDLVWGFRMAAEHQVDGVYERTMIKEQTVDRIAQFIADRLGVDRCQDPRPLAWTSAVMGVLNATLRAGAQPGGTRPSGDVVARFDDVLRSTAEALGEVASARSTSS